MGQINANLQNYEEYEDLSPVPPGEYLVRVSDSVVKEAKSSGNIMAEFTMDILGPAYAGRKLWDRFVLNNDVALRRMKTFAKAAGHRNPNFVKDTEEFHGLKVLVRVKIEEQDGYEAKNVIAAYKPANGYGTEKPVTSPPPPQPAQGSEPQEKPRSRRPWEK